MPIFEALGQGVRRLVRGPRQTVVQFTLPQLTVMDKIGQLKSSFIGIFLKETNANLLNWAGNTEKLDVLCKLLSDNQPLTAEFLRSKTGVLKEIQRLAKTLYTETGLSFDILFLNGSLKIGEAREIAEIESSGLAAKDLDELGISYFTIRNGTGAPYREFIQYSQMVNRAGREDLEITYPRGFDLAEAVQNIKSAKITIPNMVHVPELNLRVMKGIATGLQLIKLVKAGYEVTGQDQYYAEIFKKTIADKINNYTGVGYVSWLDGRAFAKELNQQNPGRRFRLPTKEELVKLGKLVGNKLNDTEFYSWTVTSYVKNTFVVCDLRGFSLNYESGHRCHYISVRLVEDLEE